MDPNASYGLWPLVAINAALSVRFAMSFFHPKSGRGWRVMGGFSAFLLALFTEMCPYARVRHPQYDGFC